MTTGDMSTVVSSDVRRNTIVNLKQVNELPLRNALESFDKNGDGKIDVHELQKIIYWYGLWKYASIGLCLVIMLLVWSTFGLTVWAINLTKDYTVTGGVMTGAEEVVKMSVANTYIPLSWASLLDRRHLDSLDSLTIEVAQGNGKFAAGVYHVKVASYVHANSTYIKLFGEDGSRVWVNSGTVVLHHPDVDEAVMVCGAAACNTLAVDVKPEYLQQLVQRSAALFQSNRDFRLPESVDGVAIRKAAGEDVTCKPWTHKYKADFAMRDSISGGWDENYGEGNTLERTDRQLSIGSSQKQVDQVLFSQVLNGHTNTIQGASLNANDHGIGSPALKPQPSVLPMPATAGQIPAAVPNVGANDNAKGFRVRGGGVAKASFWEQSKDNTKNVKQLQKFNSRIIGGRLDDDSTGYIQVPHPEHIGKYQGLFYTYPTNSAPAKGPQRKPSLKKVTNDAEDLSTSLGREGNMRTRESFFYGIQFPDMLQVEDFLLDFFENTNEQTPMVPAHLATRIDLGAQAALHWTFTDSITAAGDVKFSLPDHGKALKAAVNGAVAQSIPGTQNNKAQVGAFTPGNADLKARAH